MADKTRKSGDMSDMAHRIKTANHVSREMVPSPTDSIKIPREMISDEDSFEREDGYPHCVPTKKVIARYDVFGKAEYLDISSTDD